MTHWLNVASKKAFIDDIKQNISLDSEWKVKLLDSLTGMNNSGSSSSSPSNPSQAPACSAAPNQTTMETVEQMKSYLFQCQKMGFTVGSIICPKESDEITFLRIKSMNDDVVELSQMVDGHELAAPDIKLSDLVPKYRLHKARITGLLTGWHATENPCSPLNSNTWKHELLCARVNLAMAMVYKQHEGHIEHLELLQQPFGVKVTCDFAKGTLHIPAATTKIDRKASKSSIEVGLGLHLLRHYSAPLDNEGNANKTAWVSAFWLIGDSTSAEQPPNMSIRYEKVEVHSEHVYIPILTNTCALKRGDYLRWKHGDVPKIGNQEKRKQPQPKTTGKKKAK